MTEDNITALPHTPLPWVQEITDETIWIGAPKADGRKVGSVVVGVDHGVDLYIQSAIDRHKANAALIVKCVNEHPKLTKQRDALLEALQQAEKWFHEYAESHDKKANKAVDSYEIEVRRQKAYRNLERANFIASAIASVEADNG